MTNDQELFKELDKTIISKVKIGNGEFISVKGKGTVAIESLTDLKYITDVLYVPNIDQNLFIIFEDKWCMIKDAKGRDVFKVKMRAKIFALNLMEDKQMTFSSTIRAKLWHVRLGHFHHVGLLYMHKHNLVKGVPLLEDKLADCVACQYGKQTRRPFLKRHGKQCTSCNCKYYNAFIGDYTRLCWIYFLKSKSEVANIFWKYKAWVENQSNCRMQKIRSNNGKEYTNEIFDKFYVEAGIEHQLTTPYTPQQNGVKRDKLDKKAKPGVFIGYSNSSKAYRIFQPQNGKILVSKDVKFIEDRQWNCEESIKMQLPEVPRYFDEDIDDVPPVEFEEAEKDDKWIEAMKEELRMIEKNDTWELVDRPQHRKAPKAWYSRIDEHLQSLGFVKSPSEATLYVKGTDANLIVVSVYVDDLLVTSSNEKLIKEFKAEMLKVFEMTDLGLMSYFLGMEVKQDHDGIFISQKKYAKEILNKFHMEDCKRTSTPMN
ncbi:hypothetical protein AAG906_015713 [Vitis piasezkii]